MAEKFRSAWRGLHRYSTTEDILALVSAPHERRSHHHPLAPKRLSLETVEKKQESSFLNMTPCMSARIKEIQKTAELRKKEEALQKERNESLKRKNPFCFVRQDSQRKLGQKPHNRPLPKPKDDMSDTSSDDSDDPYRYLSYLGRK